MLENLRNFELFKVKAQKNIQREKNSKLSKFADPPSFFVKFFNKIHKLFSHYKIKKPISKKQA